MVTQQEKEKMIEEAIDEAYDRLEYSVFDTEDEETQALMEATAEQMFKKLTIDWK